MVNNFEFELIGIYPYGYYYYYVTSARTNIPYDFWIRIQRDDE